MFASEALMKKRPFRLAAGGQITLKYKVCFFATVLLHFKGGEVKCERGDERCSQHRTAISHNLKYLFLMKYTYFKDCLFGRSNVRFTFSALLQNRACVLMHL